MVIFCHVRSQRRILNLAFVWITELCWMLFWTPIKYHHYDILTTAGEGTWMLGTDRGRTWLAKWHRTTPSVRAAPRSLGNDTFNRDSIFCRKTNMDTQKVRAGFLQLFRSAEHFIRGRSASITTLHPRDASKQLSNTKEGSAHYRGPELTTIWQQLSSMMNSFHCTAQGTNRTIIKK